MAKTTKQAPIKMHCDKCNIEAMSTMGSIGKYHQNCSGRRKGSGKTRKECGKWVSG